MSRLMPVCIDQKIRRKFGFTLVEILIVLAIFSVLTAIALPVVRTLVTDQKGANASRSISAYIDGIRRRAIADGRPMGVLIERLDTSDSADSSLGKAAAIRLRQMNAIPAYTGESSNARAVLREDTTFTAATGINSAQFDANDSQLIALSARLIEESSGNPPIRAGDLLELPGGLSVRIIGDPVLNTTGTIVTVHFDLRQPEDGSFTNPSGARTFGDGQRVKYKIHRQAVRSSSQPFDLPRGLAIDLNYSGMGPSGNEFSPDNGIANNHIVIMFGSDGRVIQINDRSGAAQPPTGLIFFCLGDTDGIRPDSLLSTEDRATANLLNLKSIWIVVNPNTGRVFASPNSSSVTSPTNGIDDPDNAEIKNALRGARQFALLSDTVDNK